jgi:hypothetical protein
LKAELAVLFVCSATILLVPKNPSAPKDMPQLWQRRSAMMLHAHAATYVVVIIQQQTLYLLAIFHMLSKQSLK